MNEIHEEPIRSLAPRPGETRKVLAIIGIPVLVLVAVVAAGALGADRSPSPNPSPVVALEPSNAVESPPSAHLSTGSPDPAAELGTPCIKAGRPFRADGIDLTGAWLADDAGIYYIRQIGSTVWWNGMSGQPERPAGLGREWNNVARGELHGLRLVLEWADVPRGTILGKGRLTLIIGPDAAGNVELVTDIATGGFGGRVWTPCEPE